MGADMGPWVSAAKGIPVPAAPLLSCPVSRRGNGALEPTRCPDSASRVTTAGPIHAAVGGGRQGSGVPQHALVHPNPFPPPATPAHSARGQESPIDKYTHTSVTRNSRRVQSPKGRCCCPCLVWISCSNQPGPNSACKLNPVPMGARGPHRAGPVEQGWVGDPGTHHQCSQQSSLSGQ